MSYWDEPGIAIVSDYVKFENFGDTVSGVIIDLGIQTWQDGSKSPKLTLRTADGDKVLTASQFQLKQKMAELRPEVGDSIKVTLEGVEKLQDHESVQCRSEEEQPAGCRRFLTGQ
jgi:hypothetical protein